MKRKINIIISIIESPNGKYYGFRFTRCRDGRQVVAQTNGGDSNIRMALTNDGVTGWRSDYYLYTEVMPEKELFALTYAGSQPDEIRAFVAKSLRTPRKKGTDAKS